MYFSPEGFLNIIIGDEGAANDSHGVAQKINERLFSGILRIDVDKDLTRSHLVRRQPQQVAMPAGWANSFTQGYTIPDDNPWLDPAGGILEEFWTVGLRSPYSMFFDAPTGEIWVSEVGQNTREEITLARRGGNHQWPFREGTVAGPKSQPTTLIGTEVMPIYDYSRSVGGCIIGGMVYRGTNHSRDLQGKYLFGDHNTRNLYALSRNPDGTVQTEYLTNVLRSGGDKRGLSGICEGPDGEAYFMELGDNGTETGVIYKLVRTGPVVADPPALLSQTGAFTNLQTLTPRAGLMAYGVNSPLWTDGSVKKRWIAVPSDGVRDTAAERITYQRGGSWTFPAGTVLVKHFALPDDERNPGHVRPVETRFFVLGTNGKYYGLTYKWNAAGTDASLLATEEDVNIQLTMADGTTRTQVWSIPGRGDCKTCHSSNAGDVLGVRTQQINGSFENTANQLVAWNALGLFGTSFAGEDPAVLPRSVPVDDPKASLDLRVRSYLDANCSHCHQPGGATANFDARLSTPLSLQQLVNGMINRTVGSPDDKVVTPGNLSKSLMHVRASAVGAYQMPPLGKNVVDQKAVDVMADWILSLDSATFPNGMTQGLQAEYFNGKSFQTLVARRNDPQINFQWGEAAPAEGVEADNFSVRWTGRLVPPTTGNYTLHATSDDGVRVTVNGTRLIDAWVDRAAAESSGTVALTAGKPVDLVVEYYDAAGSASMSLAWTGPGIAKQVIPVDAFKVSAGGNPPVALADNLSSKHGNAGMLNVLVNDSDSEGPPGIHGVTIVNSPQHGSLRISGANKRLVYTHDGSANWSDSFTYMLTDPGGLSSAVTNVSLTIPQDFAAWQTLTPGSGLTNEDGDHFDSLLEFSLGGGPRDGGSPAADQLRLETANGISLVLTRPTGLSGLSFIAETSPDLVNWQAFTSSSIESSGVAGTEKLRFANLSARPNVTGDQGFVRLKVTTPEGIQAVSLPFGWRATTAGAGSRSFGVPFRNPALFASAVTGVQGSALKVNGTPPLPAGFQGYAEVLDGAYAGHRFEVAAALSSTGWLALDLTSVRNTLPALPDLTGSRISVSAHHRLGEILPKESFSGSTNPSAADQVQFHKNGAFQLYYLLDARPGNATHQWRAFLPGGGDQSGRIVAPGEGMILKRGAQVAASKLLFTGQVRSNPFVQPLGSGITLVSSPFPVALSPRQRGLANGSFTASTNLNAADQFLLLDQGAFRIFYLLDHPSQPDFWRETVASSPNANDLPLFQSDGAAFIRKQVPLADHQLSPPWPPNSP